MADAVINEELLANFDVTKHADGSMRVVLKQGKTVTATAKPRALPNARSQGRAAPQKFQAGPFECDGEPSLAQFELTAHDIDYKPKLSFRRVINKSGTTLRWSGPIQTTISVVTSAQLVAKADVTCRMKFASLPIPAGPLASGVHPSGNFVFTRSRRKGNTALPGRWEVGLYSYIGGQTFPRVSRAVQVLPNARAAST